MNTNIVRLPEEIKQELQVDTNGQITVSVRGAARLADVDESSLRYALNIPAGTNLSQLSKFLTEQGFEGAGINQWNQTGIPDIAIAFILEYYAYECREDRRKEQAKKFCRAFRAIGFRAWAQQQLGWQAESTLSLEDTITLANFASTTAQKAGVSKALAETIKLDSIMQIAPQAKPLLQPQKQAITSAHPLTETAVTPTIVGQRLATTLGLPKISSRAVNKKLLALGYQTSVTRIKRTTGKEVHDYYRPTEKTLNGNYGQLEMTSYQDGTGKNTKYQLRWFNTIVEILANNWETES